MTHETNPVLSDDFATEVSVEEMNKHFGYIYRITNMLDGRVYVGKHHHKKGEAWNSYRGSGTSLKKDIERFGWEHFEKALIEWVATDLEASLAEALWIERALATGCFYNNSNANSAMEWNLATAHFATAHRRSFDPPQKLKEAIRVLRARIEASPSVAEKSALQRDFQAYLLALGIQTDRDYRYKKQAA